jgi:XRE family transcriptional regulator, fatty acid utilization regulator
VSLTILQDLAEQIKNKSYRGTLCKGQISRYVDSQEEYLMISFAKLMSTTQNLSVSVSMGIFLNEEAHKTIAFLNDPHLTHRDVNETCERCQLFDCKERMAAPIVLQRKHKNEELRKSINRMLEREG